MALSNLSLHYCQEELQQQWRNSCHPPRWHTSKCFEIPIQRGVFAAKLWPGKTFAFTVSIATHECPHDRSLFCSFKSQKYQRLAEWLLHNYSHFNQQHYQSSLDTFKWFAAMSQNCTDHSKCFTAHSPFHSGIHTPMAEPWGAVWGSASRPLTSRLTDDPLRLLSRSHLLTLYSCFCY